MLTIGTDMRHGRKHLVICGHTRDDEFTLGKVYGWLMGIGWIGSRWHQRDAEGVSRLWIDFAWQPGKETTLTVE